MTSTKKRIAAALTATILTTALAAPATAMEPSSIRVSSYKGSTLEVGERSGLIIGPSGTDYSVTSSDPDTVAVEQVLTFWAAVAKAEGTVEIIVSNSAGERGSMTLTVVSTTPAAPEAPTSGDSAGLTDNLEIRQEMIRLINQTQKANGVSELPVSEALMNAAQSCSNRRYTWHHAPEESRAAAEAGYPYGFVDNLIVFTGTDNAAQRAVDNWINSPVTSSNVIKLAAKKETAEGNGIPKEIQKELIRKKRQQKQTEAAPSEKGHRKGQRAEA